MNAVSNLDAICQRVVDCYKKIYGDAIKGIFLYGSYARGDFDDESDIDFAAIVEGVKPEWDEKRNALIHEAGEIDLDYNIFVSTKVIPADYFDKYFPEMPYYQNILKEGKKLA